VNPEDTNREDELRDAGPAPAASGEDAPGENAHGEESPAAPTEVFSATPVYAAPVNPDPYGWYAEQERLAAVQVAERRTLLLRLRVVLAAALAAFCLITLLLVRSDNAISNWLGWSGPSRVVREHLEALSRGEAREAYAFFSEKYRGQIPLRAYEQLVSSHRAMFRTHLLSIATPAQQESVAVLDTRLAASSGAQYRARFTLVRIDGRWFIDQVRWSDAPNPASFTRI